MQDALFEGVGLVAAHVVHAALVAADVVVAEDVVVHEHEAAYAGLGQFDGHEAAHGAAANEEGALLHHHGVFENAHVAREDVHLKGKLLDDDFSERVDLEEAQRVAVPKAEKGGHCVVADGACGVGLAQQVEEVLAGFGLLLGGGAVGFALADALLGRQ